MENDNENQKLVEQEADNDKKDEAEKQNEEEKPEDAKKAETNIGKKESKEENKKEENKIVFMKKGSYSIHILIQEIKNVEKKDAE